MPVPSVAADARILLLREIRTMQQEVQALPSDKLLWRCPSGITNSIGTLGLHLAGNLRHFVGKGVGGLDYTRDRTREFEARDLTRQEVVDELALAANDVEVALASVSADQLERPITVGNVETSTQRFLLHLSAHAALHVGQAGYLRRILTGEERSVGVTPLADLQD
ncbi:MAG: DUF1572 family protein [Rhodothermales bacterium]|nr:DUF1572 family protein [Rhodothermales bacterium]